MRLRTPASALRPERPSKPRCRPGGAGCRAIRILLSLLLPLLWVAVPAVRAQAPDEEAALPPRAPSVDAMVPAGWAIEQQQRADLNRDGRRDTLLLLQRLPAAEAASAPGGQADTRDERSPQRAIAVLLGVRGGYALAALNARLVPRVDLASQEDPLADGELVARRGGFDLKLSLLAGVGSYQSASLRYRFRYRDGCFQLVGYDRFETHRATLDTQDLSIDFLAGTVVRTTGNAQSGARQVRRERLAEPPRRTCFQELGSAADYQPL